MSKPGNGQVKRGGAGGGCSWPLWAFCVTWPQGFQGGHCPGLSVTLGGDLCANRQVPAVYLWAEEERQLLKTYVCS